jgi:hypothetical protein
MRATAAGDGPPLLRQGFSDGSLAQI